MLDVLPRGWVRTTLADVCLPVPRVLPAATPDAAFTYFDIGGIDGDTNRVAETKTFLGRDAPSRARQAVQTGDILFSTVRTYLRKIAPIEEASATPVASTGFAVIRAAPGVVPQFLFYQVISDDFLEPLNSLQAGTSYPAVRPGDVFSRPILLPPTHEQERIVAAINESWSRLAASEAATRRALVRLDRYRSAVLDAAFRGELTRGWRGRRAPGQTGEQLLERLLAARRARLEGIEHQRRAASPQPPKHGKLAPAHRKPIEPRLDGLPPVPRDWAWASLDQITVHLASGSRDWSRYYGKGRGTFLMAQNIQRAGLDLTFRQVVGPPGDDPDRDRSQVKKGDILVTIVGANAGDVCMVPEELPEHFVCQSVALLRLVEPGLAPSVWRYLAANEGGQKQWRRMLYGAGRPHLSFTHLRTTAVPIPPPDEQVEIGREIERRTAAADRLGVTLDQQLESVRVARQTILREAFAGNLAVQDDADESVLTMLARVHAARDAEVAANKRRRQPSRRHRAIPAGEGATMKKPVPTLDSLRAAWDATGRQPNARQLFDAAGFTASQVVEFYELLGAAQEIREAFESESKGRPDVNANSAPAPAAEQIARGRFRLVTLWLEDFKNLKNYEIRFDPSQGMNVVLGWNGTGKSNLFEALVIIFRDLHRWWEKNQWTGEPMAAYRLAYEMDGLLVEIDWSPPRSKRPEARVVTIHEDGSHGDSRALKREEIPLPRFVFGYYSGPTNRLAEHFLPMKRDHYDRLRSADSDDPATLARLLEQRRFFCAETHHAKYVLLAFSYKEDPKIAQFLKSRLRILGFGSALFVIRRPRWARKGTSPEDFWGATGIMRRVMDKLRRYAVAPMVVKQTVSDGYRSTVEDHYFFSCPTWVAYMPSPPSTLTPVRFSWRSRAQISQGLFMT